MKLLMLWLLGVPAMVATMLLVFFVGAPHAAARLKVAQAQCSETRTTCGMPSVSNGTLVPSIVVPSSSRRAI
jgi:hypothetical protein